jgi:malic enzyme
MYVFPGIGLGAILCKASLISQEMVGGMPILVNRFTNKFQDLRISCSTQHSNQH